MPKRPAPEIKVIKVRPYPFSATLKLADAAAATRVEILRLTPLGLILRHPEALFLKPGQQVETEFALPVSRFEVKAKCKVIKIYNRGQSAHKRECLAEAHFIDLNDQALIFIQEFEKKTSPRK